MSSGYEARLDEDAIELLDHNAGAQARVEATRGNNVTRFRVVAPGQPEPVDVFLPPEPPAGYGPSGYSAGNPILFPFPNRVRGGIYDFEGRTYQLDINETARGNHIHGLVSSRAWQVESWGATAEQGAWQRASIQLDAFPDIVRQYPFPCRLTVLTRLMDGVLIQEIAVANTGSGRLPFGYGTHPWFPARLGDGRREDTRVRVPGNRYWELERLVPTGRTIAVDEPVGGAGGAHDLRAWPALDGNEYDDVFTDLVRRDDGWSESGIVYPNVALQLTVEASPEFREWVIFAPAARPVVCLEPYTGTTNAVNLAAQGIDAGLLVLEPGATWTGVIRTSLRPGAAAAGASASW
jgi:aldose 1-epimerase